MAFADPDKNISFFGLRPGMQVADFGAGNGSYVLAMSRKIVPNGKIYAIDIQKELLIRLKNQLTEKFITKVDFIWGDLENLGGSK
jgi:ubiquinone/menaquinone biosynthesis C-methylase UbiE